MFPSLNLHRFLNLLPSQECAQLTTREPSKEPKEQLETPVPGDRTQAQLNRFGGRSCWFCWFKQKFDFDLMIIC